MKIGDLVETAYTKALGVIVEIDTNSEYEPFWKVDMLDGTADWFSSCELEVLCK
jgi:hypothetical protein